MKYVAIAAIYLGFYGAIAVAVYVTDSAWPLIAIIFTPSISNKTK